MTTRYARVMLLSGDREIAQALADGVQEVRLLKAAAACSEAEAKLAVMRPRDAAAWRQKIEFAHMLYDGVTRPAPRWRQKMESAWCTVWLGLMGWKAYFRDWWVNGHDR